MSDLHIWDDHVTLALLGALILLTGLSSISMILRWVARPPYRVVSFRWLHIAWVCLLTSSAVWSLSREVRLSAAEAGTDNFVRLAFLLLGVSAILYVGAAYKLAFVRELSAGPLGLFFFFSMWSTASTLWSVAPASSLYKSLEYCAMLLLFALAVSLICDGVEDSRRRLLALKCVFDWNWFLTFLLIASVYVGMLIWPEYAIRQGYREEVSALGFSIEGALPGQSANMVGETAGLIGIIAAVRMLLQRGSMFFYVPVFAISLITMVLTQSRSPILAFLLAGVAVLIVSRRFGILVWSVAFAGATLLVSSAYSAVLYEYLKRGQSSQEIASLTERTSWWEASLEALRERPFTGYGANAGGRYVLAVDLDEEGVSNIHNVYMEVLVNTGAVGLVIFVTAVAATWFWLIKLRTHAMGDPTSRLLWFECLAVLTFLSVRQVFEVGIVWSQRVLVFGVVLVFIGVMRRHGVRRAVASAPVAQPVPAGRRRRRSVRG